MSRHRVLVCGCGSVAAVKLPEIVAKVAAFAEVRLVLTDRAAHFFDLAQTYDSSSWASYRQVAHAVPTLRDADEWSSYAVVKRDPVVHIEVARIAARSTAAPAGSLTAARSSASGQTCCSLHPSPPIPWQRWRQACATTCWCGRSAGHVWALMQDRDRGRRARRLASHELGTLIVLQSWRRP